LDELNHVDLVVVFQEFDFGVNFDEAGIVDNAFSIVSRKYLLFYDSWRDWWNHLLIFLLQK
jgi:hypothetical protein